MRQHTLERCLVPFFLLISAKRSEAELTRACRTCGAITYLPLAYAWPARSVACFECSTKLRLRLDGMAKRARKQPPPRSEIGRLLATT